jgi:hypothetical protein
MDCKKGNRVDFSLVSPLMMVTTSGSKRKTIFIPLRLDDGLFALSLEPLHVDDPRYSRLPKCDVTPCGDFHFADEEPGRR